MNALDSNPGTQFPTTYRGSHLHARLACPSYLWPWQPWWLCRRDLTKNYVIYTEESFLLVNLLHCVVESIVLLLDTTLSSTLAWATSEALHECWVLLWLGLRCQFELWHTRYQKSTTTSGFINLTINNILARLRYIILCQCLFVTIVTAGMPYWIAIILRNYIPSTKQKGNMYIIIITNLKFSIVIICRPCRPFFVLDASSEDFYCSTIQCTSRIEYQYHCIGQWRL